MQKHIIDENTGIPYTLVGDYYLPNLILPAEEKDLSFGKYGRMRLNYLKKHRRAMYISLKLPASYKNMALMLYNISETKLDISL